MLQRKLLVFSLLGCLLTLSLSQGQSPEPRKIPSDLAPLSENKENPIRPVSIQTTTQSSSAFARLRTAENLSEISRQSIPTFQRGAEFLNRLNQPNGRFLHGWITGLNKPLDGDHFLHQAMSTFALARVARFTGDEKYGVHARQAVLSLLSETIIETNQPGVRRTIHNPVVCNRLAGVGTTLMAIGELPEAPADLIARAEELGQFIKSQQKSDGSFQILEGIEITDPEEIAAAVGPALYGLALSQRAKPAAWKTESLKAAANFYRAWFSKKPTVSFIPWATAAYSLSYEQTKEACFAECVMEMNDWLCKLQYEKDDPLHPEWRGGFQSVEQGKITRSAPDISSALDCQSLADACKLLRSLPKADVERFNRYQSGLQKAIFFLTNLQFTKENTLHLSPKIAEALVGGFHHSPQDGNLRCDESAWAVSALVQYLQSGAERE